MKNRRIYSLNKVASLICLGFKDYQIVEDEEKPGLYYFIFPESEEIGKAIRDYSNNNINIPTNVFAHIYSNLRNKLSKLKGGC